MEKGWAVEKCLEHKGEEYWVLCNGEDTGYHYSTESEALEHIRENAPRWEQ